MSSIRNQFHQLADDPDTLERESQEAILIHPDRGLAEMRTQAESRRWWSQLLAIAKDDASRMKDQRDIALCDARERCRERLEDERPTEKRLDSEAIRDPHYQRVLSAYRAAELLAAKLQGIVDAFDDRAKMLQSMNSRACAEFNGLPRGA